MHIANEIKLRELELRDIPDYLIWTHPAREYHKFNGPYFKRSTEVEHINYVEDLKRKLEANNKNALIDKKIIANVETDEIIGQVNWYWKSKETLWMEIGVVIFNESYWGKNIGFKALKVWVNEIFSENPNLVRLGLTTWSGNTRMMKLAEKLGFKLEAVYRKARIVNGEYFDSISYGILKKEWNSF